MKRRLVFGSVFLLFTHFCHAQDAYYSKLDSQAIRSCLFIEDDQLRLRCFDDATGRSQVSKNGAPPQVVEKLGQGLLLYKKASDTTLSWFDRRWELAPESKRGTFSISPYKPVYLLPLFHNSKPNNLPGSPNPANVVSSSQDLDQNEAKFQLSLKTKVWENMFGDNGDLWFAYTQSSRWQVYNSAQSRPFRETNYEPEVIFTWRASWNDFAEKTGWNPRLLGLSLNHQSNGRANPLSRSWNRIIGMVGMERENTMVLFRPWVRIPEKPENDDNSDIEDYMGRADMLIVHKTHGHELSWLLRHNLRGGDVSRGAVQFDWAFPISSSLKGHMQIFSGYGESLIDYNHRSDYFGLGLSLVDWY